MAQELPGLDNECFFIAPIGPEGSPERKRSDAVLKYIVARAAAELNLVAIRADQIAEPGQITLQVIEHVLGAKAAVVDLTDLNPNVFYELAIRHTARLPVALIAETGCRLPFDIAQMRTIFFDSTDLASADQCRSDIAAHLREALFGGSVDSPITTTLDVRTLQSGSVVERNVAELVTSIEELARGQRELLKAVGKLDESTHVGMTTRAADELLECARELSQMEDPLLRDIGSRLRAVERLITKVKSPTLLVMQPNNRGGLWVDDRSRFDEGYSFARSGPRWLTEQTASSQAVEDTGGSEGQNTEAAP